MRPQSFLGSFGGTTQRSTNMVHYKCCVPIYNKITFLELQLFSTITEFFKDRDAPGLSSSVRINLRRSLTGGLSTIVLATVLKRSLEPMRS